MNFLPENYLEEVFGDRGFRCFQLSSHDLELFRSVVAGHYRDNLLTRAGICEPSLLDAPISTYHLICEHLDHASLWVKKNRILPRSSIAELAKTDLFQFLDRTSGGLQITGEEGSGFPEVYWRLVRPHPHRDVGATHADAWFWELNPDFCMSERRYRVKIWVGLWSETGAGAFKYFPGRHLGSFDYESEKRGGRSRPLFDENACSITPSVLDSTPGSAIVFNDRLLHGGLVGGASTRVSLEFTFLVD